MGVNWSDPENYFHGLDTPVDLADKHPKLVDALVSFHKTHENMLVVLAKRERQLQRLKALGLTSTHYVSKDKP